MSRHGQIIFMAPCSSERVDSIVRPRFINVSHCKPGEVGEGRGHVEGDIGFRPACWQSSFNRLKHVSGCLTTPLPPPLAFSCPPLLLFALRSVVGPHFHFSRIDFTLCRDGKASLWWFPVIQIFVFSFYRLEGLEKRQNTTRVMMNVVDTQQACWSEYRIKEKGIILVLRCFCSTVEHVSASTVDEILETQGSLIFSKRGRWGWGGGILSWYI